MSKPALPSSLEPLKLAQKAVSLSGMIAASKFVRTQESGIEVVTDAEVELEFGIDEDRQRFVKGSLSVDVEVTCQRCLQPMRLPIRADFALAIVFSDEAAAHVSKQYEPWLVSGDQDRADIVSPLEDELLLGVPVNVMHPEAECNAPNHYTASPTEDEQSEVDGEAKQNPFAMLADLKDKLS
ncbi:YceD family protein [Salinibius halmophilus]|uniref:YceD family protein n=1 Tax=Salinibius halmophilus TaxID=1853216 RepID=UPI000E660805|nr:YceD family protein [Salinibius halmophilus]